MSVAVDEKDSWEKTGDIICTHPLSYYVNRQLPLGKKQEIWVCYICGEESSYPLPKGKINYNEIQE